MTLLTTTRLLASMGYLVDEQWTSLFLISVITFSWSISFAAALSSFSAPTKFVPLSDRIFFTLPWRAMKRRNGRMNKSLERNRLFPNELYVLSCIQKLHHNVLLLPGLTVFYLKVLLNWTKKVSPSIFERLLING